MSEELTMQPEAEELVDEVEIESYGRENRKPPTARRYVIRIDKKTYTVEQRLISGLELLNLASKDPIRHKLYQKLHGGQLKEISPNEQVDLAAQGIERFQTVPLNETEG
jgi:hypothetical protein